MMSAIMSSQQGHGQFFGMISAKVNASIIFSSNSNVLRPRFNAGAALSLLVCGLLRFGDGLVNQANLVTVSPDSQQLPVLVP